MSCDRTGLGLALRGLRGGPIGPSKWPQRY